MKKYTIRKFEGDDLYSWAVFYSADVKGIRGVVFYEQAQPIVTGCSRSDATHRRDCLEQAEELRLSGKRIDNS